jgi:hypothetical protein
MKKLVATFLLAGTLTSCFAQPGEFAKYKDSINHFTIGIPAGWRYGVNKTYPEIKLIAIRNARDSSDKPHENFNLNVIEQKNSSLDIQYEKLVNALRSTTDFSIAKSDTITINGQFFKWFIEEHKNSINALPMSNYVFVTFKNEKTYILTFVAFSTNFREYEALFLAIAKTFMI